jgi:hypothetical protein
MFNRKTGVIMKVKQVFAVGLLALTTGAVFAQQAPLSRAQVVQSVLAARAAGTLMPAGAADADIDEAAGGPSTTSRAAVKAEVQQARADGSLSVAGDRFPSSKAYHQSLFAPSTVTRDQVKEQVQEARADGALPPAGRG